jgi:ATP-dependent helicase/nuclease subunit A
MSAATQSPDDRANARQREAADPRASAWVSASAGAGKTKVLTDRVLRLLLDGAAPERILCLTFTKAAAAEMSNRLAGQLSRWAAIPDDQLAAEVAALAGGPVDAAVLPAARRLFAAVLDAPGGVRIQTIHAFCQSLLKRFPIEARVLPHFTVMDERDAAETMEDVRRDVLLGRRSATEDDPAFADALARITGLVDETEFDAMIGTLSRERGRLLGLRLGDDGLEGVIDGIYARLGLDRAATPETVLAAACAEVSFDGPALRIVAEALLEGSEREQDRGRILADWLATPAERAAMYAGYRDVFFTQAGERRAKIANKGTIDRAPDAAEILSREAERLEDVEARLKAIGIAESTAALLRIGDAMLVSYGAHKRARARLDYDDLIIETRDLLQRPDVAPWVLYKLDGGIDHILIDEAQDTSPEQWQVIAALAEEFFAGESAREAARTVFAVGDVKQSIFSIQRADPGAFARMRDHFAERVAAAGRDWRAVTLDISFRSTEAVLAVVDRVFRDSPARDGLGHDGDAINHTANRSGEAGLVELWPLVEPAKKDEDGWRLPTVVEGAPLPVQRLARRIAATIGGWIDGGAVLESKGRPIQARDVMVLVRRRNELVTELVRALKAEGVPVAGVDRMVLTEQIAVMDLLALANALLLPQDDLTLATVLKGPLIGLDEEQLYTLAYDRGEDSLWRRLGAHAGEDTVFGRAHRYFAGLLARADYVPPYELFADLLASGGRRALVRRLGPDAEDPIDEFLALALAYDRAHVPSLQGFLHWVESGKAEIKRDLEQGERNEIRIMTVHGAKGLQAPIVFLPDTTALPPATSAGLLWPQDEGAAPLWLRRKGDADPVTAAMQDAAASRTIEEYRRLFYVAMTRAEDRLYICGWRGKPTPPQGSWYEMAADAMRDIGDGIAFEAGEGWSGDAYRLASGTAAKVTGKGGDAQDQAPLPDWALAPAPDEPAPPTPLAPSRPAEDEPAVRSPIGEDSGARFQRGLLIHRLLQTLPELPQAARAEACRRFLARPASELPADARDEIAREALAVLDAPEFAAYFGPGSLAEAPIAGQIGDQIVAGQVDRLLVAEDAVTILDFKSNRPPPERQQDVAPLYLRQMAAYRAILRQIYPDQPVRCGLLWTDGPRLMLLDDALLDPFAP